MASIMKQQSTLFAVGRSQQLAMFFWLVIAITGLPTASSLTCYCEGSYCNNDQQNGTCETSKKGYCFSAVEEVWDESQEKLVLEYSFGCLPSGIQGYMQCKGYMLPHFKTNSIRCCREDICNMNVIPVPKVEPTEPSMPVTETVPATTATPAPTPAPTPVLGFFKENAVIIVVTTILVLWAMVAVILICTYPSQGFRIHSSCMMIEAGSKESDQSIEPKSPIFFFGSKGKQLALPYIHVDKDAKVRY